VYNIIDLIQCRLLVSESHIVSMGNTRRHQSNTNLSYVSTTRWQQLWLILIRISSRDMQFESVMAEVFWYMTPCSFVVKCHSLRGARCLRLNEEISSKRLVPAHKPHDVTATVHITRAQTARRHSYCEHLICRISYCWTHRTAVNVRRHMKHEMALNRMLQQ
jgi:hypothetical protein